MRRLQSLLALVLCGLLLAGVPSPAAKGQTTGQSGLVCSSNSSATFTLSAQDGYINTPDNNYVYMWGFAENSNPFQYPGPVLCVNQGQTVTIVLNNKLSEPVSIIFPGQDNVQANGQPAQPQFDTGGALTSLTNAAAPNGSVTYSFIASEPGTYIYESGTNAAKQVQMGLFGALIVRPAGHPDWAYNRADTQFNPANEYVMFLSEIDPVMHQDIENGQNYDAQAYTPRYWMINGRSFPDTIAPNHASWLPNQPYSSLVHIRPYDASANPLPALVRYLSVGPQDYPFHPHGNHARTIARDGHVLEGSAGQDASFEKFTTVIGPGQTVDTTFTWDDAERWDPTNNPLPITIPQTQNLTIGEYFSGDPYLGKQEPLPAGTITNNQCGEYYHVAHNHALQKITSWGITMSGMLSYTRIDPPLPNSCPQ